MLGDANRNLGATVIGMGLLAAAGIVALLLFVTLSVGGPRPAGAQAASCEPTDLGALGAETDAELSMDGRWTTEDCDSRFLTDSDAVYYSFRLAEDGQVKIELSSPDGDSYLHLLDEDGAVLSHDDDTGPGLDARIESNLVAGVYLVEAAEGAGRVRGPADFTITVRRAAGCETTDLGVLEPGDGLTVEGAWTKDACGARFREDTPAHIYAFQLPEEGLVRIDLTAPTGGDPYLYLLSSDGSYLYSDDDAGAGRNSRIENDLAPGSYIVEATTYGDREHAHELTDFELKIRLVDEDGFRIKAEAVRIPLRVVAGEPLSVHYRVGNAGRADLPERYSVRLILVSRGLYRRVAAVSSSDGRWTAGVNYHAGDRAATQTSTSISQLTPFENVTFNRPGVSWAFLAAITDDDEGEEVEFHGIWADFLVLEGFTFDPVTVKADGDNYQVSAVSDDEGMVTTTVALVSDPDAEVRGETREKALYAAGVLTQKLEGIFQRPAISGLDDSGSAESVSVADPSSDTLLALFAHRYAAAMADFGLAESVAAGQAVNPVAVEDLLLDNAESAGAHYASLASAWKLLLQKDELGLALPFEDAVALHAQLAYAETVVAPAVKAGETVEAARAAETGWDDPDVQAMVDDLEDQASCRSTTSVLRGALADAEADVQALLAADAEMRAALPVYGAANDAALCAASDVDDHNTWFVERLDIPGDSQVLETLGYETPEPPTAAAPRHSLRIIARLGEDGRVELGVELSGGQRDLPTVRYLPADSPADQWRVSTDVEVDDATIGRIRARRLADGQVELGFLPADGEAVTPDVRYLDLADVPTGLWLRTSEIQVLQTAVLE